MLVDIICGIVIMLFTIETVVFITVIDKTYERGHREGWDDCYLAHKQFEMSEDDDLVLDAMKKALKEYIRKKKYVKDVDRKSLDDIEDFEQFKHFVFLTCICRKEMGVKNK